MTWRLKDQELQRKLDEISGGDFTEALQKYAKPSEFLMFTVPFRRAGKNTKRYEAYFFAEEIEEVPQYDPHKWNEWPSVEPPYFVFMRMERLETQYPNAEPEDVVIDRFCGFFSNGVWHDADGFEYHPPEGDKLFFRPWDEPYEREDEPRKKSDESIDDRTYSPKAWNKWPEVIPPNSTQYFRAEFDVQIDGERVTRGERWMWEASRCRWVDDTGAEVCTDELENVRFRPWDDDAVGGAN